MADVAATRKVRTSQPVFEVSQETRSRDVGAFFPQAHSFVINGGHFTSHVTSPPTGFFAFRNIPLGDLDLRNEIHLHSHGVVNRQQIHSHARRIYSAHINGSQSNMTVAIYHGDDAEENWKTELAKYSAFRHPNLVQLFGVVKSGSFYATIFHDDLVPVEQFLEEYRHTPIIAAYLYAYFTRELQNAKDYFHSLSRPLEIRWNSISWIRRSTGRLYVEVSPIDGSFAHNPLLYQLRDPWTLPRVSLRALGCGPEKIIISSLTLAQYHQICYWYLATERKAQVQTSVPLGAIVLHRDDNNLDKIAHVPDMPVNSTRWKSVWTQNTPVLMQNGWTRFDSTCVNNTLMVRKIRPKVRTDGWLSQANRIFSQLPSPLKHDDYFLIYAIDYWLPFPVITPTDQVPGGYLFLCPLDDLQSEHGNWLWHPKCPAYWSLDPFGEQRLNPKDALALGLPTPKLKMDVWEKSWQTRVYDALSHFHTVNGFDPHSLNVASHAGLPIFQLFPQGRTDFGSSGEISSEFSSHFDEESSDSRQTDTHGGLKPTHIAVGIWLRLYLNILLGSHFLIVAFVAILLSAVLFRGQWLN